MDMSGVCAQYGNDDDAQETVMAVNGNGGRLSHSAGREPACGDVAFLTLKKLEPIEPMKLDSSLTLNVRGKKVVEQLAEDLEHSHLRQMALEGSVLKIAETLPPRKRIGVVEVIERMHPAKYSSVWDEAEVEEAVKRVRMICRPVAAQFEHDGRRALLELAIQKDQVWVRHQRDYLLVLGKDISPQDLAGYNLTAPVGRVD